MSHSWQDKPSFSLATLRKNFADAPDVLESILEIFAEEAPTRVDAIRSGLDGPDFAAIKKAAHSLANTTGTLEAERALLLSRATEEAARREDADETVQLAMYLVAEVESILEQIRSEG
jgi:HPt (histidine-containing phosphotransfer) domain-containing protein